LRDQPEFEQPDSRRDPREIGESKTDFPPREAEAATGTVRRDTNRSAEVSQDGCPQA
jgi:hypothetical protein